MSLFKEKPLRSWLKERETLIPRKKLVDLIKEENPEAREQARRFSELMERRGFRTTVRDFNRSSIVDFYDPELRRMMIEVGAPYDREKAGEFALSITGSLEFTELPGLMGTRVVTVSGDIPVAVMRRPMARGFWREGLEIPEDLSVKELHWHTEDGLPATHVHVWGEDLDLYELSRFIGDLRDVSKGFMISDRMPR